ncbi:TIGR01244 family sulfur transferase [Brevundimonas sp. M20]|uniref:TIGR01244 family sulfur transferase n=1 Tax=Brevundimonas sp. M20 TaxID=2591463 RepID=UPI0011478E2C|nr:TIGR01244 family sulfur transferase [Brevundimonas sp. M20]QDH73097.1 TIGR01244 family phosphatase [Brevundimonas sp. M20]
MGNLSETVTTSPQLSLEDFATAKSAGFAVIVNHRPDGEEPGQPNSVDLAAEASRLGLDYIWIPVSGLPDRAAVEATAEALARGSADKPVLMFCRSGMRSTAAWAMAVCAGGADPDEVREAAAAAGYDLSRLPL